MIPNHLCRISSRRKYLGFGVLAAGGNAMHFQDRCSSSCINLQLWTFAKCYHLMRLPTQFSTILWQESLHRIILSSFKFPTTIFRSTNGIFKGMGWRAGVHSIYMRISSTYKLSTAEICMHSFPNGIIELFWQADGKFSYHFWAYLVVFFRNF